MQGQVQFCHKENKPVIYVKDLLSCVILCSSIKPTFVASSRPLFKIRQLHQTHTKESTDANKNYDPVLNLSASLYLQGTRNNRIIAGFGHCSHALLLDLQANKILCAEQSVPPR